MRRTKKSVGRILLEDLAGLASKLLIAVIAGGVAYNVVVSAFAEEAKQTAAP